MPLNMTLTTVAASLAATLLMGTTARAQDSDLREPPAHAQPAGPAPKALPHPVELTGPMVDAGLGRQLMQVEANPPVTQRGAGGEALERLFAARCRSVVFIAQKITRGSETSYATGTGSIVSINGHVLTAEHVVEHSDEVGVGIFPNCKPGAQPEFYPARVVKRDRRTDLAVLQLTQMPSDIAVMPLGQIEEVRTGSNVVIIGHPRNLLMSLSQGLVSAIRPDFSWQVGDNVDRRATVIQTDGALNPGNSGGPMMSSDGNLIGVNSFIRGQASAGLNFAVAVSEVRSFISGPAQPAPAPVARAPEPSRPAPAPASCRTRTLKEWKEGGVTYTTLDTNCQGKANAMLAVPEDTSKRSVLLLDRNDDGKVDARIYLSRSGEPEASEWDDDYNGSYDFRGEHNKGEWAPHRKVRLG